MISGEQIFVIVFTVWAWGLSVILAVHLHTHRQRVRDETADEPAGDAEAGYGLLPVQPNANPLSGIVEELQRELDAVKRERDTLLACRAGEQGCFVCPDGNCHDNENPKFASRDGEARRAGELQRDLAAADVRLTQADRLAYAVADALIAPCRGEVSRACEELVRYVNGGIDGPLGVREFMRRHERAAEAADGRE